MSDEITRRGIHDALQRMLATCRARAERAEAERDRYRAAAVRIYDGIELDKLGLEDIHTILMVAFDPADLGEGAKS